MKFFTQIVWLLGALLVIATLDNVPDPLANSPSKTQFSVSSLHEHSVDVVTPIGFAGLPAFLPAESCPTDGVESLLYSDRDVAVEHAADPSPPALHSLV